MTLDSPDITVLGFGVALFSAGLILIAASTGEALNFRISIDPERKGNALVGGVLAMVFGVALGVLAFLDLADGGTAQDPPPSATVSVSGRPDPSPAAPVTPPTTTPASTQPADPGGCQLTTGNPLATIHTEPDVFSTEVAQVPPGTYEVQDTTSVDFGPEVQRWFLIAVGGRSGWLEDTTFNISSRSDGCP